jgi:hypothetical protein
VRLHFVGGSIPVGPLWTLGSALAREQEWILRIQAAEPDLFGLPPDLDDLIAGRWPATPGPAQRT